MLTDVTIKKIHDALASNVCGHTLLTVYGVTTATAVANTSAELLNEVIVTETVSA